MSSHEFVRDRRHEIFREGAIAHAGMSRALGFFGVFDQGARGREWLVSHVLFGPANPDLLSTADASILQGFFEATSAKRGGYVKTSAA